MYIGFLDCETGRVLAVKISRKGPFYPYLCILDKIIDMTSIILYINVQNYTRLEVPGDEDGNIY